MNNHHQNARTTFYSRALIVQRVFQEGKRAREVAEALGVSQRTVYKWLVRYRGGGMDALHDLSSRPRRSPRRIRVEKAATIAAMRRTRMSSPQIAFSLSMPLSTVTLELRRLGLIGINAFFRAMSVVSPEGLPLPDCRGIPLATISAPSTTCPISLCIL